MGRYENSGHRLKISGRPNQSSFGGNEANALPQFIYLSISQITAQVYNNWVDWLMGNINTCISYMTGREYRRE